VAFAIICLTFSHQGALIIDCGREAYYPQEILLNKVLYKDLFNIYGVFAYLFNALLYKIFGVNLNTLFFAGSICALGIITGIFLIAKRFLGYKSAFCLGIFTIFIGILPVSHFNYIFPYSFSITYGILSFLFSIYFLIKFVDSGQKKYLFFSTFLTGISIFCKYEFLPIIFVFIFLFFKLKLNLKILIKSLFSFLIIPIICFSFLFFQGLNFNDLITTAKIISKMTNTQTLHYFYIHSGVFFHKQSLIFLLKSFLSTGIIFLAFISHILYKNIFKTPIISLVLTFLAFILTVFLGIFNIYSVFAFTPILLIILSIVNFKKIIKDNSLFVVVLSSIFISFKVFWGALLNFYGIYYIPLILISIFTLIKDKFKQKDFEYISIFFVIVGILTSFSNIKDYQGKNFALQSPKGTFYVNKKFYKTSRDLLIFLDKNTQKTDTVVILPEGLMLNFLSDRKSDDFYNSLLPLYEETFNEENIINHFKKSMPEYIIFNNWDSKDYYFSYICKDYNLKFCNFVLNNYFEKTRFTGDFNYIIFQKK